MTVWRHAVFWALFAAGFFWLVGAFSEILLPFVAGMLVAYFLDPVADRLEGWGMSRTAATAIITAGFFLIFLIALVALVPLLVREVVAFFIAASERGKALIDAAAPLIADYVDGLDAERIERQRELVKQNLGQTLDLARTLVQRLIEGGLQLLNILSLLFITPVVAFYLLRDWDEMVARIDAWLPVGYAGEIRACLRDIDRTIAGFVRGQATVCLILGAFYGIGLHLIGLDFGFLIGLFTGLISFIPYFGMLLGAAVGFAMAVAQFSDATPILLVGAVFAVGQIVEGNYLTPRLVGGSIGLHPVWVMFALLAGGVVLGLLGVMIAVPVAAVIGVLVRYGLKRYLNSDLYHHGLPAPGASGPVDADARREDPA